MMAVAVYPVEFIQTTKQVTIISEAFSEVRRVYMDQPQAALDDVAPGYYGRSAGKWDGDTLVVDTVGFNGKAWIDAAGLPTTESLHVIERFRRTDLGHLEIEHTIDDPEAYTKPWNFTIRPILLDGELMEYICQENNLDVKHLVGK